MQIAEARDSQEASFIVEQSMRTMWSGDVHGGIDGVGVDGVVLMGWCFWGSVDGVGGADEGSGQEGGWS